jgi:hypothetical protein
MTRVLNVLLGTLSLIFAVVVATRLLTTGVAVPLDINEGWNAFHATAAMAGTPLYPAPSALLLNNYPPLSFYIVGSLGSLVGDHIQAGRLLSVFSFLGVAITISYVAFAWSHSRHTAWLCVLALMTELLLFTHYIGINDPQLLAHAFATLGLAVILRNQHAWRMPVAATLIGAALFIKLNLIALPMSLTLWWALTDRPAVKRWLGFSTLVVGLLLSLCLLKFGTGVVSEWTRPRDYVLSDAFHALFMWSANRCFLLVGAAWGAATILRHGLTHTPQLFALIYLLVSVLIGAAFSGGVGVDRNAFFDADIALALMLAATSTHLVRYKEPLHLATAVYAFIVCVVLLLVNPRPIGDPAEAQRVIDRLSQAKGDVLCSDLAFCYWARKPAAIDVFNLQQHYRTHPEDTAGLIDALNNQLFSLVQVSSLAWMESVPAVGLALSAHYVVEHEGSYGLLLRRTNKVPSSEAK